MSLQDIHGVGDATAKHLREDGIETIADLAKADPSDLSLTDNTAQTLVNRAQQEAIVSKTAADLHAEFKQADYASTGIDAVDDILGGGWEAETIGIIYGKSGEGKTQLAFSTIAEVAANGDVVYLQTEMQSKSIAERLATFADDPAVLENITIYEAYSISEQYNTYEKITDEHENMDLLVIDSLTAQFRMTDRFDGRQNLSDRSSVLGKHLKRLGEIARVYEIPIVLTGQVYPKPEQYGKGDVLWGGEKLRHFISYFIRMSSAQGELQEVTLENHPGKAEEGTEITITDSGISGM